MIQEDKQSVGQVAGSDEGDPRPAAPDQTMADLTPFMRQWTAAKRENPDALLFFRMGDFYELFYDDAVTVSRELQLTLTARDRERSQPMCGVPYHAVERIPDAAAAQGLSHRHLRPDGRSQAHKEDCAARSDAGACRLERRSTTALGQEQNNFLAAFYPAGSATRARSMRSRCSTFQPASFALRSFAGPDGAPAGGRRDSKGGIERGAAIRRAPTCLHRSSGSYADARRRLGMDPRLCCAAG